MENLCENISLNIFMVCVIVKEPILPCSVLEDFDIHIFHSPALSTEPNNFDRICKCSHMCFYSGLPIRAAQAQVCC